MTQTRKKSLLESIANATLGLVISWLFTYYGLPIFGISPDPIQATWITGVYFLLSLIRSYIIRRIFNATP